MLVILAAIALAVATPGPANLAIMATSMAQGRQAGVIFALGVQTGSALWALAAAFGLSLWLETMSTGLLLMKVGGGLYLLWLAAKAMRSAMQAQLPVSPATQPGSWSALFFRGAALHLTNPKAVLSWLAIVALMEADPAVETLPTLGMCLVVSGTIFQAYALLFGSGPIVAAYKRTRRALEALLAFAFGYAGVRLIQSAA